MVPRAGLDDFGEEDNPSPAGIRTPDRPAPIIYVIATKQLYGSGQRAKIRCVMSVTKLVHVARE